MQDIKISIDEGAIRYATDRVLQVFGRDELTRKAREDLTAHIKIATQYAAVVQCIGMATPIPIGDIYQRTRLVSSAGGQASVQGLIDGQEDAIIFAKAGEGKTTLLHWLYNQFIHDPLTLPLLITLRRRAEATFLRELIGHLRFRRVSARLKGGRILLLVDGYDEIGEEDRRQVSDALLNFQSLNVGSFLLTARTYYDVYELKVARYDIAPFHKEDSLAFIKSFANAYGADIQAADLYDELSEHGLRDFASHPLLLAMLCILKTGPMRALPRNLRNL